MKNKKFLKAIAALTIGGTAALGLAFAGCSHSHTFDTSTWGGSDATGHWHLSTCGHDDEKGDFGAHNYGTDGNAQYCLDCNFKNPDYKAPSQATQLAAPVIELSGTTLSWAAVEHATGYDVYRDGAKVTSVTATTYTVADTAEGSYEYTVKATSTDKAYSESPASNAKTYTVAGVFTVTLSLGDGTLAAGESATLKTVNGKINGFLPEPTCSTAHWRFDNWYDAETGGNAIDETTKVFESNATIYARYVREDGVWNADGSEFVAALSRNTSAKVTEYWLGGSSLSLEEGDEISLYVGGNKISFFIEKSSTCVDKSVTDEMVESVTVTEDAGFAIYLHDNSNEEKPNNWSCEFSGIATAVKTTSEIPAGCGTIQIQATNGTATIYLVDKAGKVVSAKEFNNFRLYTYSPELFGNWAGSVTKGALAATMTAEGNITASTGFIFRWGTGFGSQSTNIFNIEVGKTYFIDLSAATQEAVLYTGPAIEPRPGESESDDDNEKELVSGGAYLVGTGWTNGSWNLDVNNYIDPEEGLTVTLSADSAFKITSCKDAEAGTMEWKYNSGSFYAMAEGYEEGYLNLNISDTNNGAVLAPGEYTITLGGTAESPVFIFTPGTGVTPAEPEEKFVLNGYYLVGQGFTVNGTAAKFGIQEGFEIGNGLTVQLKAGDMLKAVICTNAVTGGSDSEIWKYNDSRFYRVAVSTQYEGKENGFIVFEGGNNVVKAAGSYTITVDNSGTEPIFVITPADDVVPDLTKPIIHYYIKGATVTGWQEPTTAEYEMTENDGVYTLTIHLVAGDEFMFWAQAEHPETHEFTKSSAMIQQDKLADDTYAEKLSSNMKARAAGTYTFTFNSETNVLSIAFVADSAE